MVSSTSSATSGIGAPPPALGQRHVARKPELRALFVQDGLHPLDITRSRLGGATRKLTQNVPLVSD